MTTSDDWRNGRHVVFKLHAHIVLVTKYRRGVMSDRVSELLKECFTDTCGRFEAEIEVVETDYDHVHLLVSYPPKVAISKLVNALKTNSSRRVREKDWDEVTKALWGDHFWSPSYAVVSTGGAPLEVVKKYVENQREPNRGKGRPRKA